MPRADCLVSDILASEGFAHGFFTRRGGVSEPPFESLSFVLGTGDAPERVEENLRRAADRLGVAPSRVYYLSQVHGVDAVELSGDEDREQVLRRRGDVTVSRAPGVGCGVRSADCATVLLGCPRTGAAAAAHSGWRGTVQNVAGAAVRALCAGGSKPGDLVAAVGPHIEVEQFEVGADVAAELAGASRAGEGAVRRREGKKPHVDLRAILQAQLEDAGLSTKRIDHVPGCTVRDEHLFFSYRRDGKVGGRLLSAIAVRAS